MNRSPMTTITYLPADSSSYAADPPPTPGTANP